MSFDTFTRYTYIIRRAHFRALDNNNEKNIYDLHFRDFINKKQKKKINMTFYYDVLNYDVHK